MLGTNFEVLVDEITRINKLDNKTVSDRVLKFNEEFGEFAQQLVRLSGLSPKEFDPENFIEEGADALQCLISIMIQSCEESNLDFQSIIMEALCKNTKWEESIKKFKKWQK